MWKKNIAYGKLSRAKKVLLNSLFFFSPPLRTSLLSTRKEFIALANTGIIALTRDEVLKLHEFAALQQQVHTDFRNKLSSLSVTVLASVRTACDEVVLYFARLLFLKILKL